MKKFILLLTIILIAFNAFTQNYKCIIDDEVHYFKSNWRTTAIQIDSVVTDGDDLVYYNYPTFQAGLEPYCYALDGPSWIGRKIVEKPNGDFVFFNMEDEPVTIKSQADVSESWVCYEFGVGHYVEATVESIENFEFLDISDIAKKIVFQAYFSNGTTMENGINNKYLLLSENNGLFKTVNFKVFPDMEDEVWNEIIEVYEIIGIEGNESGVQNLTWDKTFNLNIGDEIHTQKWVNSWPIGATYLDLFIYVVFGKVVLLGGDSLIYQIKRCGHKKVTDNYGGVEYEYFNDTIEKIYSKSGYNTYFLDTIANRIITTGTDQYREYFYHLQFDDNNYLNKSYKYFMEGLYSEPPHECIWQIVTDNKGPGLSFGYYIEGLGGPYWANYFSWEDYYLPVYFNTQDGVWGEPLNCDSLLIGVEQNHFQKQVIRLYPNPASDQLNISCAGNTILEIVFYNFNGQKIFTVDSPKNIIDISGLKPGLYFAEIKTSEGVVMRKIVVQ